MGLFSYYLEEASTSYKDYNGLKSVKEIDKENFPFFYAQLKKNPDLKNEKFRLYYDSNGRVIAYFAWRETDEWSRELFGFDTIRFIDMEVAKNKRGSGLSKKLLNDFISKFKGKKITLQANTDSLINLYKKYGFHIYKNKEDYGNLMINWADNKKA